MGRFTDLLLELYFGSGKPKKYAGFLLRLFAFFIDAIILIVLNTIINRVLVLDPGQLREAFRLSDALVFLTHPVFHITSWLYFSLMESSPVYQGTIGKHIMKLQVVDINDKKISFGKATGRHLTKYLSGLLFGAGFIMAGFTKYKQGLHDLAAGTFVNIKNV